MKTGLQPGGLHLQWFIAVEGLKRRLIALLGILLSLPVFLADAQTNCVSAPSGLVSWWTADGYALDVVGTNSATMENGAAYSEGEVGQAFDFNGSNSYVFLPIDFFPFPLSGTGTQPFTIELWFRTTSGGVIFSQEAGPVGGSFSSWDPGIYVGTDGKLRAEVFWSGSANPMTSSRAVNDGAFHHTAVTYDGTNAVLFLDGKSIQTNKQSQIGYAVAYYYQFGVAYTARWPGGNGGWYYFNGLIDEPALYSRALNPSEIAAIYEAGGAGKCFSNSAPVLIQQPASVTANQNDNATFSVVATGIAPFSYQWRFDGANIVGATNSTLNLTNIQMTNEGAYSVTVTNAAGSATSIDASLVVLCSSVVFFENFESGQLPAEMTVSTVGGFNSSPGIESLTNFGGSKVFGFGLSGCPANCFDAHMSTLTITLPVPTYVSDLSFDEMELYGNWGSYGQILTNGAPISDTQDFGRLPINDGEADTTYRTHYFQLNQVVTNVSLRVTDITDVSEIFAANIALTAISSNAPVVLAQPMSLSLSNGATASFTVRASSTVSISYQWSLNGTDLINETNATLSIPNIDPTNAGIYQVLLANCSGSTFSSNAVLTVNVPPCDPAPSGLVAWWPGDGSAYDIDGGNNGTIEGGVSYAVGQCALAFDFDGTGAVQVPNSPALDFSATSAITVELWAYRGSSGSVMHLVGKRADCGTLNYQLAFNENSGEGLVFGNGGGDEVATGVDLPINSWHHLVGNFDGATYRFYLDGKLIGTHAGRLGNPNTSPLLIGAAGSCATFVGMMQNIRIYNRALSAGEVYSLYEAGCSGVCSPIFAAPPSITRQPSSITTNLGANVAFSIAATGTAPLAYQWQFNSSNLPGATNATLTLSNVQTSQAGSYTVIVTNLAGLTNSSDALLIVNVPPGITQQPVSVVTSEGATVALTVGATGTAPLSYQWRENGVSLSNGSAVSGANSATLTLSNVQTNEDGLYSVLVSNAAGSTNSYGASLTVLVPPSITREPTNVVVIQGGNAAFSVGAAGSNPLFYQWELGGQALPGQTNAALLLNNVQSNQAGSYSVVVSNLAGSISSSLATLMVTTAPTPPSIVSQPVSVVTTEGVTVTFSVGAIGTAPLSYQWKENGVVLSGGPSVSGVSAATLTLSNVQTNEDGLYSVLVSNAAGSTNSYGASLTVLVPPSITRQPTNVVVIQGGNAAFDVVATGTPPLSYQWMENGAALSNGSTVSGATSATLTLLDVQTNEHGTYSVVVSNPGGSTPSSPATLTVLVPATNGPFSQIAIVANSFDPEIGVLESNLFQMGYSWQTFAQGEISVRLLTNFELVIWDNLGGGANGVTDQSVAAFSSVFSNGIPLYLIGDGLAADNGSLSQQSSNWVQLTGLIPATGTGGDGDLEFSSPVNVDPILDGAAGSVSNCAYSGLIDATALANTNRGVLGWSGTNPVLVSYPPTSNESVGQTRMLTQDFQVIGGAGPNSVAARQILFSNAVPWLLGADRCQDNTAWVTWTNSPLTTVLGQLATFQGAMGNNGNCDALGVYYTISFPANLQFVTAATPDGVWQYDPTRSLLTFHIGLVPHRTNSWGLLSFTVLPLQTGSNTLVSESSIGARDIGPASALLTVYGLTLTATNGSNYLLQLTGAPGQTYGVQISTNLPIWTSWTNVTGPGWTNLLPAPLSSPELFFRALTKTNQ